MRIFLFIIFCFVNSCKPNNGPLLHYSSHAVTITRVDGQTESKFYLGDLQEGQLDTIQSYIKASYPGFNNDLDMYIVFHKNHTVELIHYGGESLAQIGQKKRGFYYSEYENDVLDSVLKYCKSSANGMIRIYSVKRVEIDRNKDDSSGVQVDYR